MSKIELYQGDCLEVMDKFIEQGIKVDAVITDPPYGTTACKWDSIIPFDEMWKRLKALRNDNTPVVLFGGEPFTSNLINSNIKNYKEKITWLKNKSGNGFLCEKRFVNVTEDVVCFYNKTTFNPQKTVVPDKKFLTYRKTFGEYGISNNIYGKISSIRKPDTGERYPINILSFAVPTTTAKSKKYNNNVDIRLHPTQKPLALMEYLVKTYTNEGDTVLDFTMGSGTTGVACKRLNRNFIGIELDENYFNIAEKRINEVLI